MVYRVLILSAGVLSGIAGVAFNNQASAVFGAILVCTPFIQKSIDGLLCKKWFDATVTCSGIVVFISICLWALESKPGNLEIAYNKSILWFIVVGAGMIQLLWILLIRPKS